MDREMKKDLRNHNILKMYMILLFLGAFAVAAFGVYTINMPQGPKPLEQADAPDEGVGEVKPLPDFILEDIKPNELEQLKQ